MRPRAHELMTRSCQCILLLVSQFLSKQNVKMACYMSRHLKSLSVRRHGGSSPSSFRFRSSPAAAIASPSSVSQPDFTVPPQTQAIGEVEGKGQEKGQEKERGKEGRSQWSRWLLFLPGAITFGLGTWQIFRRQDKIKLLEYRQKRLAMEPLKLNVFSPSSNQSDAFEFRRVSCKGDLDEKRSIFVGPRSRSISGVTEIGYYVITPLVPIPNNPESIQSSVLVNRGWVPRSWKENSTGVSRDGEQQLEITPSSAQNNEQISWWRFWSRKQNLKEQIPSVTPVEVVGVVRGSEKPSIFVPENDPVSGQWFYVDVPAIARACGLPENILYVEDSNENVNLSSPYPVPKDVNALIRSSVMPQDHLNYIFTWYSLSTAVTFMAFKRLRSKRSQS